MHYEKAEEDNNSNTQCSDWDRVEGNLLVIGSMIKHVTGMDQRYVAGLTKMWIDVLKEKMLKVLIQCFIY